MSSASASEKLLPSPGGRRSHQIVQRLALDEFHDEIMEPIRRFADVDGLHDVVMTEPGRRLAFLIEAVHEIAVLAHLLRQDLHGNDAIQRNLPGLIHLGHRPFADFAEFRIREFGWIFHRSPPGECAWPG